ncbi:hypothetical protein AMEX_G19671 [Astyanax mexicanus]|uniref:Uncharacterized protein n=1 Tax=Astyanax mexicanus TaxID=7994 RepID=A0A8T2L6Y0_ASTMX|nr:hypothetical protein AMEX_G19671 [Astyanax mexicanus]
MQSLTVSRKNVLDGVPKHTARVCGKKMIQCHAAWKIVGRAKQDMLWDGRGAFLHKRMFRSSRLAAKREAECLSA